MQNVICKKMYWGSFKELNQINAIAFSWNV